MGSSNKKMKMKYIIKTEVILKHSFDKDCERQNLGYTSLTSLVLQFLLYIIIGTLRNYNPHV